jgi:hypothetical protein
MNGRKLFGAVAAAALFGATILSSSANARPLGTVEGLPFFGHPYPFGYVYRRPPVECYSVQQVDTPVGPRIEVRWICDGAAPPVTAAY